MRFTLNSAKTVRMGDAGSFYYSGVRSDKFDDYNITHQSIIVKRDLLFCAIEEFGESYGQRRVLHLRIKFCILNRLPPSWREKHSGEFS